MYANEFKVKGCEEFGGWGLFLNRKQDDETYLDYVNVVLEAEGLQQDLVHVGGTVPGLGWRHKAKQELLRRFGERLDGIRQTHHDSFLDVGHQ